MSATGAVLTEGGFFVPDLEESLTATLERLDDLGVADVMAAGWTLRDILNVVVTTPPFNDVLTARIQQHLLRNS